jgi:hypothetical protein
MRNASVAVRALKVETRLASANLAGLSTVDLCLLARLRTGVILL